MEKPDGATELLTSLKDKKIDCELIEKIKKTRPNQYENFVMALTKLYLAQGKTKIVTYGMDVEAENFYLWRPMGDMKAPVRRSVS